MLQYIIAIIANALFFFLLNVKMFTDRAVMPNGETRVWHRSPLESLSSTAGGLLYYVLILFAAVSVITNLLALFGVKNRTIDKIRRFSTIASVVVFLLMMIFATFLHPKYA